jgi:DNA mismatch repair protein MutS
MGLMYEYFSLLLDYEKKYGSNVLLLMQVGSFYEIYETDIQDMPIELKQKVIDFYQDNFQTEEIPLHFGKVSEIERTSIKLTKHRRNSKPPSFDNCWTSGFPIFDQSTEKTISTFIELGYIVILYDQVEVLSNNKVKRKVTSVLRDSIENKQQNRIETSSKILVLYIYAAQKQTSLNIPILSNIDTTNCETMPITCGISYFDIHTGENGISEFYGTTDDPIKSLQKAYEYIYSINPKEIYIRINNIKKSMTDKYSSFIEKYLELENFYYVNISYVPIPTNYLDISYQNIVISNILNQTQTKKNKNPIVLKNNNSINSTNSNTIKNSNTLKSNKNKSVKIIYQKNIVSRLGLEELKYGVVSYMLCIEYIQDYDSSLLVNVSNPKIKLIGEDDHLVMTHNSYTSS